jgi:hypothetical protein
MGKKQLGGGVGCWLLVVGLEFLVRNQKPITAVPADCRIDF